MLWLTPAAVILWDCARLQPGNARLGWKQFTPLANGVVKYSGVRRENREVDAPFAQGLLIIWDYRTLLILQAIDWPVFSPCTSYSHQVSQQLV